MSDDEGLARLLRVVQRIVRDPEVPSGTAEERRAWLERAGLSGADLDALAALPEKRLLLYRKLVRRGLTGAIRAEIPRTAARMEERFDRYAARWQSEELPRSHYLRDVAFEFVAWAVPLWAADPDVPSYIGDLARHELSAFEVAAAPPRDEGRCVSGEVELELDRGVRFDAAARVMRYAHAVHRLLAHESARDVPESRATVLLAYRDADQDVRYLELTPLAAAIVQRLMRGETLRSAVMGSCADLGQPLDEPVLSGTAELLSNLGERGVLEGPAP